MHQSTGELYKDTSHQGGASSSYKLTHKNGDVQYFSNTGRWLVTYNRFGNCIKVVNGSGNEKMVIEDTVGRRVVFSDSVSGNTTTQTVTMPDGSKTKLAYVRNTYNNYAKTLFDKKTDAAGNVTKYEYTVNADDNYKNVLLKKITMPTGLQNCYEYG